MAQRYQRDSTYQPPGVSMARAQTAQSLADTLAAFRRQVAGLAIEAQTRRGAQAGAESTGTPRLRSNATAFGRAYNDAALRNYVIEKYSEAEVELGRLEAEAGADPDKFRALADGLRRGAIQGALPQARAQLSEIYQRRIAEGIVRLDAKRIQQQKELNRATLQQGLDTVADSISRKMASGNPVLMAEAEQEENEYAAMIDGAVESGDLTPAEAVALKAEGVKRVTQQIVTGEFERQMREGDPVRFIARVMDQPVTNLSDEEKQQLVGQLFQRLNRYQALIHEQRELADAEQKARWKRGEQVATVAALRRQLSVSEIARMVENDELDPAVGRTLESMITSPAKAIDDPQVKFQVETNLLRYSEEDIANMAGLSHETRADLILKRREEAETWRNDQGAQEALRRIDVALGIPSGLGPQFQLQITPEKATAAAKARSYFYDLVEALPEAERKARYFEMADKAVKAVGSDVKRGELARAEQALRNYLDQVGPPDQMDDLERAEYEATVKRRQEQINRLRQEIGE